MGIRATTHFELEVYCKARDAAMEVFELSKLFPFEERFSLTDQIRRSSRSVCGAIAEAWRRRRYEGAFVEKINQAEAEAAETQSYIDFAVRCQYVPRDKAVPIFQQYDDVLRTLVGMINHASTWLLPDPRAESITPKVNSNSPPHPVTPSPPQAS